MKKNELPAESAQQKDGIGFRILLKFAAIFGLGWAVMLVIVRILGIIVSLIVGPIVGVTVLLMFPEAHTLVHWAAFIFTPLIVWGITELFIWYYSSPIDTLLIY